MNPPSAMTSGALPPADHGFSRRTLLRAAGIGAGALAGVALTGCTAQSPNNTGSTAGGLLKVGMFNPFQNLDPSTAAAGGTTINDYVYERLYRIDPYAAESKTIPELAVDLPEQISPTTYRIKLRENVTFHDGSKLTADDVVFTIKRLQDPATKSLFARYLVMIENVKATSPTEIELTLSSPTTLLADRLVLVSVLSQAAVSNSPDALKLKPVGTGPYQVVSATSGQKAVLQRFAGYTGSREVNFDSIEVNIVPDANARISGLRSKQWSIAEEIPASNYQSLREGSGIKADAVSSLVSTVIMFHCGKAPFNDPRVRQAVLYAIDRDSITQSTFFGQAEPAWTGLIRPDDPDYTASGTVYRYDPARAKQLLSEAGYGSGGIKVDFLLPATSFLASQGPVIEANLKDVGFTPNIIPGELTGLYSKVADGSYNMLLERNATSALGPRDVEFNMRWLFYGAVPKQYVYWSGPEQQAVERQLDQALAAADDAQRKQLLGQIQKTVQEQVPIGTLHFKKQLTAWSEDLQNFRPLSTQGFNIDGVRT